MVLPVKKNLKEINTPLRVVKKPRRPIIDPAIAVRLLTNDFALFKRIIELSMGKRWVVGFRRLDAREFKSTGGGGWTTGVLRVREERNGGSDGGE